MRKATFTGLCLLLVACSGKKAPSAEPQQPNPAQEATPETIRPAIPIANVAKESVLALVNGEEITESVFNQRLGRYVKPGIRIPEERLNKVKKTILERIIDDRLILQAAQQEGVTVTEEEIKAEFEEHRKRFKSPRQFDLHLQQSGMTEDLIQQEIRVKVTLKKLLTKRGLINIGEEQARQFYEKNASLYKDQDQVHAAHILVKLDRNANETTEAAAQEKIKRAQAALKSGRDFKELATEVSDGPSKSRGGDLGFFRRGQMVRAFEEVAFALEPGSVSEPVRTQFGWHIIKVFGRKQGVAKTFDEVKDGLIESLTRKKVIKEKRLLIKELRAAAQITIHAPF